MIRGCLRPAERPAWPSGPSRERAVGRSHRPWRIVYALVARLAARYLAGSVRDASVYLRGTAGSADLVPAVSDIDFVVVVDDGDDPAAVHLRWERLARRLPLVASVVDRPRVHRAADLERLVGRFVYTIGLDGDPAAVVRDDDRFSQLDRGRLLERPGLHDTTLGWRLLVGSEDSSRRVR